ncbi:MAG: gliding motility-associated C-terminal domain-containing protein, partial [Flavisolibacter sp.]|nr:gliding motility-associated C-terminal domain-containing protein [Flavisolibacter sp.]
LQFSVDGGSYAPYPTGGFSGLASGAHTIKVKNAAGCETTLTQAIGTAPNAPAGTITPATAKICSGSSQLLTATGGTTYQWSRDGVVIPGAINATYLATQPGNYSVVISNGTCNAPAQNAAVISFQSCSPTPETKIFVPTAFTPNNNNTNDYLQPYLINIRELIYFKVYNRWGQLVFQTNTIGKGWDGTIKGEKQPTETYTWILECIDNNGKTVKQSGRSILIR